MSFGKPGAGGMKSFESQDEVDERKKRRQEEWDRVRKPDDPLECPEEDTRSLYEKLQEQKERQQQEYEDQFRFRNSVKGLEKEEAEFLDFVSRKQVEIEKSRKKEEDEVLKELKASGTAPTPRLPAAASQPEGEKKAASKPQAQPSTSRSSQQALIMGAVKRKSAPDSTQPADGPTEKQRKSSDEGRGEKTSDEDTERRPPQMAQVIGILPGIGAYSDDSTGSDSSSSDSSGLEDLLSSSRKFNIQIYHSS